MNDTMAEKGSDLIYDVCCAFCEDDKINREATVYCKQCSKGLCDECVKHHNKLYKTHSTFGREDKKMWPVAKTTLEALMFCEQHPDHRFELFCEDHSKLCCLLCHLHDHRQCSKVSLVDVKAKEMRQKGESHKVAIMLEAEQQTIQKEINTINTCLQALQTSHGKAHADIKVMRQKINDILDTFERNSLQSLNTSYETLQKLLQSYLAICFKAKADLQQIKDTIKDIDDEKYILSFVAYAKSMESVSKAQVMLKAMSEIKHNAVEFRANTDIEQMLSSLSGLGDVMRIKTKQERKASEILKRSNTASYNVRINKDQNSCCILGISELSSGHMLITDNGNNRVKLLDAKCKVIAHTDLPVAPRDMCSISPTEVAVTIDENDEYKHFVQFLIVNNRKIVKDRVLEFEHECLGIAHFNGSLFITSGTTLYHYTLNGELVKKIYEDASNTWKVYKCAVDSDGSRLFVTDYDDYRLLTLSMDGTVLSSFEDPGRRRPTGVHVSETGQLLVCWWGSDKVSQVNGEGGSEIELVCEDDGLQYPWSVHYSASSRRLFVGQSDDHILVSDIQ